MRLVSVFGAVLLLAAVSLMPQLVNLPADLFALREAGTEQVGALQVRALVEEEQALEGADADRDRGDIVLHCEVADHGFAEALADAVEIARPTRVFRAHLPALRVAGDGMDR